MPENQRGPDFCHRRISFRSIIHLPDSSMPVLMLQTGNTQPLFSRHINMSEKTHVKQRTECLGALNTHT